jgi:hypothetical protein
MDGQSPDRQKYPQQRPLGSDERRGVGLGLRATAAAETRTKRPLAVTSREGVSAPKRPEAASARPDQRHERAPTVTRIKADAPLSR